MKFLATTLVTLLMVQGAWAQSEIESTDNNIEVNDAVVHEEASYSYSFGSVRVNHSASANFTLRNTGRFPIYINSISVSGASYSASENCPKILLSGQRCRARVRFSPTSTGWKYGKLQFKLTGASNVTVSLSGRGVKY